MKGRRVVEHPCPRPAECRALAPASTSAAAMSASTPPVGTNARSGNTGLSACRYPGPTEPAGNSLHAAAPRSIAAWASVAVRTPGSTGTPNFIGPLIGLVLGQSDFSSLAFEVAGTKFAYGDFLTKLITFSIIGVVVYFLVIVPYTKLVDRYQPGATELGPVRDCPHCLSSVHRHATVCSFCGRDLPLIEDEREADREVT